MLQFIVEPFKWLRYQNRYGHHYPFDIQYIFNKKRQKVQEIYVTLCP